MDNQKYICCVKAIEKNKKVSTTDPEIEEVKGATYHDFFLNDQKYLHLNFVQL